MQANVDLHSHSNHSDGQLSPAQVAHRAHANGVQLWALSDHDNLSGIAQAQAAADALGMGFIAGVEISVTWGGRTIHVLGLNIDPQNQGLQQGLAGIRKQRSSRALQIANKLAALGMPGAYEGALQEAKDPQLLGRVHFARFLLSQGYCASMQEAFKLYLGDGKQAYIPTLWVSLEQALGWINAAGGKAVIAHPGRYTYGCAQEAELFSQFKDLGGVAVEVISGCHSKAQYRQYAKVTQAYGLQASRGSDFHAPGSSRVDLGLMPALPAQLTPVWHDWL